MRFRYNPSKHSRKTEVATYFVNFGAPPVEVLACSGEEDGQEDQHSRNAHRRVHGRAEDEVVLAPPCVKSLSDHQTEGETHSGPATIVHSRGGRKIVQPTKEQRDVDSLP